MKKLFTMIVAALAFFSVSKAQDVYVSGTGFNENGKFVAVVYRNNERIFTHSLETMDIVGYGVQVNPYNHDEVYNLALFDNNKNYAITKVFRNEDLYVSLDEGSYAMKLYWFDNGTDDPDQSLYMLGRQHIESGYYTAVWHGNEVAPLYMPDAGDGRESMAVGAVAVPGSNGTVDLYYGGSREDESNTEIATVWKNDAVLYTLGDPGELSIVASMDYDDGVLYSLVYQEGTEGGSLKLFAYDELLYTYVEGSALNYTVSVKVDAGDVYVYAYYDQGMTKVWRNEELLYTFDGVFEEMYDSFCLDVTADGVYYVSMDYDLNEDEGHFYVFHNETALQAYDVHELFQVTAMDVAVECADNEARALPYFEGFEMGTTDWECWVVTDEGENNDENGYYYNSYWHRQSAIEGVMPSTGDYCAMYRWNDGAIQDGWLISPQIRIPSGMVAELSFDTYERYSYDMEYEGVWISTTNNDLSSFVEVWNQDDPTDEWKTVKINLADYQGQDVYIAFRYKGFDAHSWYIDDVGVNEYDAVGEQEHPVIAVCPNPAKGSIRIEGLESSCEVQLYNSLGELVKIATVVPNQEISIDELAFGLYLLRCGKHTIRFVKKD